MFKLKFSTANEAFDIPSDEIARILRNVAETVETSRSFDPAYLSKQAILDMNGNTIGEWEYRP